MIKGVLLLLGVLLVLMSLLVWAKSRPASAGMSPETHVAAVQV